VLEKGRPAEIRGRAEPVPGRAPTMEDAFIAIVEEARAGESHQGATTGGAV
jgi:ABC-2 type transport system ATP-binding protein